MTEDEIMAIAAVGEDSRTQFKRNVSNPDQLAQELVAFSNARGGRLFVGVEDDASVRGLSSSDVRRLNQMVSNVASQHVVPPICPLTETVRVSGGAVMVVDVPEGSSKPYSTNRGLYLTKVGADKRRVAQEELQRLFQESSRMFADEGVVAGTSEDDLDEAVLAQFFRRRYRDRLPDDAGELPLSELLPVLGISVSRSSVVRSLGLSDGQQLTLAGLLLFGREPQRYRPVFTVKCVSFFGNDLGGTEYRDREEYNGPLSQVREGVIRFLLRNLRKVQSAEGFNAPAQLELPHGALEEAIVNALVHRDYFINAPIRVLLFDDRLEILSPGRLPNSLTVENIKAGISVSRNPILHSVGQHLLPYTGLGSGIRRILDLCDAHFHNDEQGNSFRVTFGRFPSDGSLSLRESYNGSSWGAVGPRSAWEEAAPTQSPRGRVTADTILRSLQENPSITARELGKRLGITEDGVRYHLKNLKRAGRVKRVGSARRGRWLVVAHQLDQSQRA